MDKRRLFGRRLALSTGVLAAVLGLGFLGLAAFLTSQGLDRADKWASVVSGFVGVAGLVLSVLALRGARAGRGTRVSIRTGDVSGRVVGVRGDHPTTDLATDVTTRHVRDGGSVIGLDLTATAPPADEQHDG